MKTILFKIWKFPQLSETFIINQIITTIKLGYNVKILVGELNELSGVSNTDLFKKHNLLDKVVIENYSIPANRISRYLKSLILLFKNLTNLRLLFKYYKLKGQKGLLPLFEFDYYKKFRDIHAIHIQFGTNKHPVDILKLIGFLKSKLIVSFHGHDLYFPINGKIMNDGYYNNLFLSADYLIGNTPFLKEKLIKLNAPISKIKIIPVAVDTSIFKPTKGESKQEGLKLLSVGRLDELKGQIYGIKAVNLVLSKGFLVEYTIAGSGDTEKFLKNHIEKLRLTKNIFLIGKISPSEVSLILQESDIFLMTSVTNSAGMEESQGLVIAEAQACGLPVIAFDSGGIKYTLIDGVTGFLCKERDINAVCEKIQLLIENSKLRKKMGENAVAFVNENYSENSVFDKWKKIYG